MVSRRRGDGVGCHNAVAATPSTRRRRRADRRGIAAPFSASPHLFAGGKPGFYPEIKGKGGPGGHFLFNLWDPFNFTTKRTVRAGVLVHTSRRRCGGVLAPFDVIRARRRQDMTTDSPIA